MQAMINVLLVDDGPDLKPLLDERLVRRRIAMITARSGAEAIERMEQDLPDLVVCDVYVPDMDGYQICERVRAHPRLARTPVLLMADVVDRTVLARAARVGANGVVRKPCLVDELIGGIEEHLGETIERVGAEARSVGSASDVSAQDPQSLLTDLAGRPGVVCAVLMDEDGFVIERAGELPLGAETLAALASGALEVSARVGREAGHGALRSMICEFERGVVLLASARPAFALAVVLHDRSALDTLAPLVVQLAAALSVAAETSAL